MKTEDLAMLQPMLPTPKAPGEDTAAAAAEVFARLLVNEIARAMPDGGLLGDGPTSVLSGLATDALATSLTQGGSLGFETMFEPGGLPESGTRPPPPDLDPVRNGTVSSPFGMRAHPLTGLHTHHDGIDIGAELGTPIRAARGGVVRSVENKAGYGNLVILDHGNGRETRYAHCDKILVKPGEIVEMGQHIADVGQSGRTTGPHLHFEVRQDGQAIDPQGPRSAN